LKGPFIFNALRTGLNKNPRRRPGVEVMITIFSDFHKFSAKKIEHFLKTNVMIFFLQNSAAFCVKNANFFRRVLGENI
jgi:hypothetical protein